MKSGNFGQGVYSDWRKIRPKNGFQSKIKKKDNCSVERKQGAVTGKEFFSMGQWPFIFQNQCDILKTNVTFSNGIAIYRKERSFRGRKVPSAEGRFLYGRKLLNKIFSKISL